MVKFLITQLVKNTLPMAAFLGGAAVLIGAFGAHALPDWLNHRGVLAEDIDRYQDVFETGSKYHLVHSLALWGVGLFLLQHTNRWATAAVVNFLLGISLFSGCLYAYALTGIKVFGAIVPLGGIALIAGWLCLARAAIKVRNR